MKHVSVPMIAAMGAALMPGWVWAQTPSDADRFFYGPHMMGWGGGWYGMFFGPLIMILVLAAVIAAAVFLVRGLAGQASPPYHASAGRTPLDILRARFARGEIDKTEFEDRRRALGD